MTEKKMKKLLRRVHFHLHHLENALTAAHREELLKYEDYTTQSPCASAYEARKRFKLTTEKQIAKVIQTGVATEVYY